MKEGFKDLAQACRGNCRTGNVADTEVAGNLVKGGGLHFDMTADPVCLEGNAELSHIN